MRRLFLLVALLSLVVQGLGAVVSVWTCEGKTCSTNSAECCCSSPSAEGDPTCKASRDVQRACAGKCGCKLTVKSVRAPFAAASTHKAVAPAPTLLDVPAILPPASALPTAIELEYVPALPNPPPALGRPPLLEGAPFRAPPFSFA